MPLIEHVIQTINRQTDGPVLINTNAPEQYAGQGLETIQDTSFKDGGPLAGVWAALHWACNSGHLAVVTVAVDTPFLPSDLLNRLSEAEGPSIGSSGGRIHPVCGRWPDSIFSHLSDFLSSGERAAAAWSDQCGARHVVFNSNNGIDPFFNINTKKDLAEAEHLLSV